MMYKVLYLVHLVGKGLDIVSLFHNLGEGELRQSAGRESPIFEPLYFG